MAPPAHVSCSSGDSGCCRKSRVLEHPALGPASVSDLVLSLRCYVTWGKALSPSGLVSPDPQWESSEQNPGNAHI